MGASEQLPGRPAWRSLRGDWYFLSSVDALVQLLSSFADPSSSGTGGRCSDRVSASAESGDPLVIRLGMQPEAATAGRDARELWRRLLRSDAGLAAWVFEWIDGVSQPGLGQSECLKEEELLTRLAQWTTLAHLSATVEWVPGNVVPLRLMPESEREIAPQSPDASLLLTLATAYCGMDAWVRTCNSTAHDWQLCRAEDLERRREAARQLVAERAVQPVVESGGSELVPGPDATSPGVGSASAWRVLLARLARLEVLEAEFDEQLRLAKLAAMRELAYGASHEINNPLANIASRAQLLLRDESDPQRRRALATIHGQAMRAHEMIADMMLFAKPPRGDRKSLQLHGLLRAWAERQTRDLPSTVSFRCDASIECFVEADAEQFCVAWDAIARNAVEAMEGFGSLVVRLERTGGPASVSESGQTEAAPSWAWVVFEDTGPGLSKRTAEHLFDPFFSGREAGRGLGFGLSKAWRILEMHGGALEVESRAEGLTVRWGMPCV